MPVLQRQGQGSRKEERVTRIDEAALVVGQQNTGKNQTRAKRSGVIPLKMPARVMLDHGDKEIKINGASSRLELSIKYNTLDLSIIHKAAQ